MVIGVDNGERYESRFEMLSSRMPSSAPEMATGEVNPNLSTQTPTDKMEAKLGAAPAAVRMFAQTLSGDMSPINETHFKTDELEHLRSVAEKSLSKGKNIIGYGDYEEKDPWAGGTKSVIDILQGDSGQSLAFTLGMAKVKREDDGTIVIKDNYHWAASPEKVNEIRGKPIEITKLLIKGLIDNGLLGPLNVIGNLLAPQGEGRPVEIRIPPKKENRIISDEIPMGLGTTAMMRKEQFVGTRSGEGGGGLSRETITGAAIKTGKEIHQGPNHSLIAVKLPDKALDKAVDGFMTSSGRFVTREEAAKIVKNNGQERSEFYKEKRSGFSLGTEDLKDLLPGSSKAWQQYLGE